jgi:hypothetical protein
VGLAEEVSWRYLSKDGVTADSMIALLEADGVVTKDLVWHGASLDRDGLILKILDDTELGMSLMLRGG